MRIYWFVPYTYFMVGLLGFTLIGGFTFYSRAFGDRKCADRLLPLVVIIFCGWCCLNPPIPMGFVSFGSSSNLA